MKTCKINGVSSVITTSKPEWSAVFGLLIVLAIAGFMPRAFAASTLPLYEPFPSTYGENENFGLAGSSGVIWDFGNSISSSCGRIATAAAQSYPGLVTDISASKGLRSNPTGSGAKNRGASLTTTAGQTLYASFLLKVITTNITSRPFFGFSVATSGAGASLNGAVIYLDPNLQLSLAKNSGTPASDLTAPLTTNNTYLIVLRYKFNTGSTNDDEVALWVSPNSYLGVAEANVPTPTLSTTTNSDLTTIGSVAYFQNTSTPGLFYIDEVRVSTNWAEVTPQLCTPNNIYAVTGGGVSCGGAPVPVGLSGSELGIDYWLLVNNGSAGSPVPGTGGVLNFGGQTNSGNYSVYGSNTVTGCTFWMNNSVNVTFSAPPAIVSQPAAMNIVSGAAGTFSVIGTGNLLTYQWRKNGVNLVNGGNVSGATTPNLTLYPVGGGDVATSGNGYDVVVSGTCAPPATSTRVSLTLKPLSNLVWVGDGISNLWDVATTQNWQSGGSPAVFSFGDKVTFDESSANGSVMLSTSFLSPSTMVVSNSAVNYAFGGDGRIMGPANLVKTGPGLLSVTNAHSFTGGTVISNGVVLLAGNEGNATLTTGLSGLGPVTNAVTFYGSISDNAVLELFGFQGSTTPTYNTFQNPVVIPANFVGAVRIPSRGATAFPLSGAGTLNLVVNFIRDDLTGNWSTFTGLINVTAKVGNDQFRINNTFGYANAAIYLNDAVNLDNINAGNISVEIGELGGTSLAFVGGGDSARSTEWRVGRKNTSAAFDGVIRDGTGATASVTKVGTGTWTLTGSNPYSGPTVVSNGVLALSLGGGGEGSISGSTNIVVVSGAILDVSGRSDGTLSLNFNQTLRGGGTIRGNVDTQAGGSVQPGTSVGTLTVTNGIVLGGETIMELQRSGTPNSDRLVAHQITCGGTLTVTNIGTKLFPGDTFQLLSGPISGTFAAVILPNTDASGATYTWTNRVEIDGTIAVLTSVGGVNPNPTNITFVATTTNLTLSWPSDHTGWQLQAQTNSGTTGLGTNWVNVAGSSTTNQMSMPIGRANTNVFFRLVLP